MVHILHYSSSIFFTSLSLIAFILSSFLYHFCIIIPRLFQSVFVALNTFVLYSLSPSLIFFISFPLYSLSLSLISFILSSVLISLPLTLFMLPLSPSFSIPFFTINSRLLSHCSFALITFILYSFLYHQFSSLSLSFVALNTFILHSVTLGNVLTLSATLESRPVASQFPSTYSFSSSLHSTTQTHFAELAYLSLVLLSLPVTRVRFLKVAMFSFMIDLDISSVIYFLSFSSSSQLHDLSTHIPH